MASQIPYVLSDDAVPPLIDFCKARNYSRFFLIADQNTFPVLGNRVEYSLHKAGFDIKPIILTGDEISTNEHYLIETFVATNGEERQYIAVGSGTITDITRFVSHRARASFVSVPTAPSVDGFTSTVAPMVVGKYKGPIQAQPPIGVFADLPTLCSAPKIMAAAGFGDLLGKYTSLADWRLGGLLAGEPYDMAIDLKMRLSVDRTIAAVDSIARSTRDGIATLMDGLIESGFGMLEFGDSRPASGSEHHLAHYWEMKFILEDRPAVLHGLKVGIGTILSARRYERLRQMSRTDAAHLLSTRTIDNEEWMRHEINKAYGPVSDKIINIQAPLFQMTSDKLERLKSRILENWDQIQAIAQTVPPAAQFISWMKTVNGPTTPQEIGLTEEDINWD
jgi:glycerol-1-phosphate dehydrogenase [NAD(P)+]